MRAFRLLSLSQGRGEGEVLVILEAATVLLLRQKIILETQGVVGARNYLGTYTSAMDWGNDKRGDVEMCS